MQMVQGSRNNPEVGILDPGPITNNLLLDENNKPLNGLSRGKQYRGVNKYVWQQLYNTYGGGPVIKRGEINIYSEEYREPDCEDSECTIIDSDAIKSYFNKDKQKELEEGDSQPVVGSELVDSDKHIKQMLSFKTCKLASKRSSEDAYDRSLHALNNRRCEDDGKKREEKKGSSITRRNLFKKRVVGSTENIERSHCLLEMALINFISEL